MTTKTLSLLLLAAAAGCAHAAAPTPSPSPPAATTAAPPAAEGAAALLARFKEATGGARWDAVTSFESHGTMSAGGLSGPVTTLQDAHTGRSVSRYTLGPIQGAEGYDGTTGWSQDPGGEVTALDAPEARETAKSDAWLGALGYFYPNRGAATFGAPSAREDAGRRYQVIEATPAGGRAVALWLDAETGLLARTVERRGGDTVTTRLDDYREAGGVRVPFHVVVDVTDAAGRTDPRQRVEIRLEQVVANVHLDDAAFAMPQMSATAHIDAPSGTTRVPFDFINNHIYASATIDGKPVRMLVDTGGANLLTPASAQKLAVSTEGKLAARGVGDEQVDLALAHVGEVRLGDAVLSKPVFYVIDLGALPRVEGTDADGLVGFEMFRRFRVTVDYAAHVLTLTEPAKFTPPANAHVVPFEMAERIPIVNGTLDGMPVRLSIDTGSRSSLSMHSPFVKEHDLVARYGPAPETVVGWGVGGPSRGRPARVGALTLGDVVVKDVAADLYTGDKGAFSNPDLSGNLGGGILRRFTVTFDYDARKMYLVPNADFDAPDDFDRSGMWLFQGEGFLEVAAVAPDGPASKAGLAEGDHLTKIGAEPIAKHMLAAWRARLRTTPAGTHLVVAYTRGGAAKTTDLLLADAIPPHAQLH